MANPIHPFNLNSGVTLSTLFEEGAFDAGRCNAKDPVRLMDSPLRVAAYVAGYEYAMLFDAGETEEAYEVLEAWKAKKEAALAN